MEYRKNTDIFQHNVAHYIFNRQHPSLNLSIQTRHKLTKRNWEARFYIALGTIQLVRNFEYKMSDVNQRHEYILQKYDKCDI